MKPHEPLSWEKGIPFSRAIRLAMDKSEGIDSEGNLHLIRSQTMFGNVINIIFIPVGLDKKYQVNFLITSSNLSF